MIWPTKWHVGFSPRRHELSALSRPWNLVHRLPGFQDAVDMAQCRFQPSVVVVVRQIAGRAVAEPMPSPQVTLLSRWDRGGSCPNRRQGLFNGGFVGRVVSLGHQLQVACRSDSNSDS